MIEQMWRPPLVEVADPIALAALLCRCAVTLAEHGLVVLAQRVLTERDLDVGAIVAAVVAILTPPPLPRRPRGVR